MPVNVNSRSDADFSSVVPVVTSAPPSRVIFPVTLSGPATVKVPPPPSVPLDRVPLPVRVPAPWKARDPPLTVRLPPRLLAVPPLPLTVSVPPVLMDRLDPASVRRPLMVALLARATVAVLPR